MNILEEWNEPLAIEVLIGSVNYVFIFNTKTFISGNKGVNYILNFLGGKNAASKVFLNQPYLHRLQISSEVRKKHPLDDQVKHDKSREAKCDECSVNKCTLLLTRFNPLQLPECFPQLHC